MNPYKQEPFRFSYKLRPADLVLANIILSYRRLSVLFLALFSVLLLVIGVPAFINSGFHPSMISIFILPFIVFVLTPFSVFLKTKAAFKEIKLLSEKQTFVFDTNDIHTSSDSSSRSYKWPELTKIKKYGPILLVFFGKLQVCVIPVRDISHDSMVKLNNIFKKQNKTPQNLSYSQIDFTERFGDNLNLKPDDWIKTVSLNTITKNPKSMGLPPLEADSEQIYEIAKALSALRETINISNDGVYCPVCHIANTELKKLHDPCPQCGRKLLKFGWD